MAAYNFSLWIQYFRFLSSTLFELTHAQVFLLITQTQQGPAPVSCSIYVKADVKVTTTRIQERLASVE
jgi:hypothetical protein